LLAEGNLLGKLPDDAAAAVLAKLAPAAAALQLAYDGAYRLAAFLRWIARLRADLGLHRPLDFAALPEGIDFTAFLVSGVSSRADQQTTHQGNEHDSHRALPLVARFGRETRGKV
jgi:hypothetical protein